MGSGSWSVARAVARLQNRVLRFDRFIRKHKCLLFLMFDSRFRCRRWLSQDDVDCSLIAWSMNQDVTMR
jgi:hypothetical protein